VSISLPRVALGDLARLVRRSVVVDLDRTYVEIGIRSFGRGIFHKEPVAGADLGAKRIFSIHPGDLVLNNVFAWEGAISIAQLSENRCVGSHRFLTYVADESRVHTGYLRYYLLTERGLDDIRRASPGSAGRNRTLGIKAFESIEVPLPSISVQRQLSNQLDAVTRYSAASIDKIARAITLRGALIDAVIQRQIDVGIEGGWRLRQLIDIAEINPSPARLEPEEQISFVPMMAVDERQGQIHAPEIRSAADARTGYKQFRLGDVIFARITPCMQKGKTAVVDRIPTTYGYGSTEFHVIRPSDEVEAAWLHRIFRTSSFKAAAAKHFTGTAGQQRVPADFLRNIQVPVPSVQEQRDAIAVIDRFIAAGSEVAARQELQRSRMAALRDAALNAFSTQLM
jgi:type I restriction enzyme S subunit